MISPGGDFESGGGFSAIAVDLRGLKLGILEG
jgi:hypothetical protein